MFLWLIGLIVTFVLSVKVYQKLTCGTCQCSAHMVGKTVIVTGGNSGIGFETAKNLADRGARVILACRSSKRATLAKDLILKLNPDADVICKRLDFSKLCSVIEFCDDIIKNEKRLDVLINNAGAGGLGNYKTQDGLHIGMQVNYFGPFLLTWKLLPLLKSSAPSRIINVSSVVHKYGEMDFDNLNMEKYWSDYLVYANSKLYLNLMTKELSERLKGSGVTVNSLHPGIAVTNLLQNIPNAMLRSIIENIIGFVFQTPWEASQTSVYLAVSADVRDVSGRYFCDCKEKKPSLKSQDPELARRLWDESEKILKSSLTKD